MICRALLSVTLLLAYVLAAVEEGHGDSTSQTSTIKGRTTGPDHAQKNGDRNGKRRAFVSFLEGSKSGYVKGSIALAHSIRKNSGYYPSENEPDMVLLTMTDFENDPKSRLALQKMGWTIRPVAPIREHKKGSVSRLKNTMTKLHVWNLVEWDTVFYIDSDVIVKRALGGVFEAMEDNKEMTLLSPINLPNYNAPSTEIVRCGPYGGAFNSGVMGVRPNAAVFKDMLRFAKSGVYRPRYGEQEFLNAYFKGSYFRLPTTYSLYVLLEDLKLDPPAITFLWPAKSSTTAWELLWSEARLVHYIGADKPWLLDRGSLRGQKSPVGKRELEYWWSIFDEAEKSLAQE